MPVFAVLQIYCYYLQVEDIRSYIETISVKVNEVKMKHSDILAAPQANDSK